MSKTNIEIGDICVCRHGHIGIVNEITHNGFAKLYKGWHITNDGNKKMGTAWQSSDPKVLISQMNLKQLNKE